MQLRHRGFIGILFLLVLTLPRSAGAQETRVVSGVVLDAESGTPVSDAVVEIGGTRLSAVTDREGGFEVRGVPVGSQQLVLRHIAYGEHAQPLLVGAEGSLDLEIRVSSRAIELAPLEVEVAGETLARRASGTATNVIDRATIEAFPTGGPGLLPILQARIPGLRVDGSCVEYRRLQYRVASDEANPEVVVLVPCRDITVYLDGVPNRHGSAILQQLFLRDVERIELLSPGEAGVRYGGAGGRGVLLVETRRGVGAETRDRVHINGLGWNEPQPYPWLRVLGLSALGSAAVAGLASRTVYDCGARPEERAAPLRCHPAAGVAGAVLTVGIGRAITHGAGRTRHTEGRTFPALLMGVATASLGYMLYVHGENHDSGGSRAAGEVVLAVGVPLTLTMSDRLFRMVR